MSEAIGEAQQAYARGDHARVIALLRPRADALGAQGLALLGNSALIAGDDALAHAAFTRLLARQPTLEPAKRALAGLHNRRGAAHRKAGRDAEAHVDFERALQLQPTHREAGYNLARVLEAQGARPAALARLEAHLAVHLDDAEAHWLALEWMARDAPARAAQRILGTDSPAGSELAITSSNAPARHAQPIEDSRLPAGDRPSTADSDSPAGSTPRSAAAQPPSDDVLRLVRIAFALRQAGELAAARVLTEQAYLATGRGAVSPGLRYALSGRLAQPPVMDSPAAIAQARAAFLAEVAQLEREWTPAHLARCEPSLEQLAWSNFYIAYHGENDRALQSAYGQLIARAAATFEPALATAVPSMATAMEPTPAATPASSSMPRGGKRIGLLSSSFRDCTAGAYFGGWVDWLHAAGHETFVYQLGPRRDAVTEGYAQRASHFHYHDGPLQVLARRVRADGLDLLIYPELGMDARLPALAALRLAPRQAMGWGHPMTSGLPTMDAYFTSAAMEPPGAQAHYTETLLPLPGLGVEYARRGAPPPATRRDLGLPEDVPLVLFPQSLFKIHPDNDAVLAGLLERVPAARLVMFLGDHPRWHERFLARLPAGVGAAIHWLPVGERERYLQINRACDLMLDTLCWSGGNTSLDALCSGLPIVTCPGGTMRSRQSAAMLERLGLAEELIVAEPLALAERTARLLGDPTQRGRLSALILAGLPDLFEPTQARTAFLAAVQHLCRKA